ncbi:MULTISPECIES: ABC transporter permease subunit [unclassified Mycoplasma]|uniref:ABC transporter permease subunit n=1 Tax=unclassified Mycoplasma TaxID=2683645 RepID=UPI00216AE0C3|nr:MULTISPECIES: ABC transporter permease subunit [unclassified Mycoplasma]MCS4536984.1 ABC transporter permease subunit [Mycoplasma sp. CSL7475-4]MCT4469355.1 ABC transporter permease subunit [Mycoplasma sp. HS2188]
MKIFNYFKYLTKNILINFAIIIIVVFLLHFTFASMLINDYNITQSFQYIANILIFKYGTVKSQSNVDVTKLYSTYFGNTIYLVSTSFIISFVIGFYLAYLLARKNKAISLKSINIAIFIFSSVPIFILGPIAIIFNKTLNLPTVFIDLYIGNYWETFLSIITPVVILSLVVIPLVVGFNYSSLKEIIQSEYYSWAKANGVSNHKIFWNVVFRNWISSGLQKIVFIYIYLVTYSMIIERFFYIPGQSFIFQYLNNPDYLNLLMYSILMNITLIFLIKSITDLIVYILDIKKVYTIVRIGGYKWKK